MNFIKSTSKNPYLGDLPIDNFFISELMPDAPGDYVKVYLYGRFLADIGSAMSVAEISQELGLGENHISKAWDYWEECGAIRKRYLDGEGRLDFTVEFLNLKEQLYGDVDDEMSSEFVPGMGGNASSSQSAFGNENLRKLLDEIEKKLARPLSVSELQTTISWVEDKKASPEVLLQCFDYCLGKGKSSFNYISTVLESWLEQGLDTQDKVKGYIEQFDQKYVKFRRVMQALGMSRNPTEEEKRIMETWFDDMGYKMERVLEACSTTAGITNPNIKYVNSVLVNWQSDASKENRDVNEKQIVSDKDLRDYYEYLKRKAEKEADERREQAYREAPEIKEIDTKMREIGIELAKSLLNKGDNKRAELSAALERLTEDRAIALVENGFDIDYTDVRYLCSRCNDTGIAEMGGPCDCREKRRGEAEEWLMRRNAENK